MAVNHGATAAKADGEHPCRTAGVGSWRVAACLLGMVAAAFAMLWWDATGVIGWLTRPVEPGYTLVATFMAGGALGLLCGDLRGVVACAAHLVGLAIVTSHPGPLAGLSLPVVCGYLALRGAPRKTVRRWEAGVLLGVLWLSRLTYLAGDAYWLALEYRNSARNRMYIGPFLREAAQSAYEAPVLVIRRVATKDVGTAVSVPAGNEPGRRPSDQLSSHGLPAACLLASTAR